MVLEFCEGGDLRKYQDRRAEAGRRLEADVGKRIFREVACGLRFIHKHNILHRDLKPDNVLLLHEDGSTAKIADFGEAKRLQKKEGGDYDLAESFRGTLSYMSPELLDSKPYGTPNDVWALGCILYEMGTGTFAFEQEKALAALMMHDFPTDAPVWCAE